MLMKQFLHHQPDIETFIFNLMFLVLERNNAIMPRAPKLSSRDLDEEFERFLKESLSDDSMDFTGRGGKKADVKKKKEDSTPWWMKDDDDDHFKMGRGKQTSKSDDAPAQSSTPSGMKWLKPKKQSTPLREVEEEEEGLDDVIKKKPSVKSEDKGKFERKGADPGAQRQISRDSLENDDLDVKMQDSRKRSGVLPEQASFEDTYSQSEPSGGLTTPGSTGQDHLGGLTTPGSTSQDYLGGLTTPGSTGPGAETLEEMADKARFFKELEEKGGSLIDYSRLNREADLSGTMGTMGTLPSAYMGSPEDTGPQDKKLANLAKEDSEPAVETPPKPAVQNKKGTKGPSMLSKVALLDTADSTLSPVKQPHPGASPPSGGQGDAAPTTPGGFLASGTTGKALESRGLSTGTTGELEALQAILREAADTPTLHLHDNINDSVTKATKERTVEDIINEVNEGRRASNQGQDGVRGFDLQPVSALSSDNAEQRGFDLQPANQDSRPGSHDQEGDDEDEGVDGTRGFMLSPVGEGQEMRGFALEPASPVSRGFDLQPATAEDMDSLRPEFQLPSPAKGQGKRRSPSKPKGRYAHIRSSGYGKPKSAAKSTWSPAEIGKQKVKGSEVPKRNGQDDRSQRHLLASVESFASYLQEQFGDTLRKTPPLKKSSEEPILSASMREAKFQSLSRERALIAEVNEWQQQWQEERRLNAKMNAEIADVRREFARKEEELRLVHEKEIFQLKQDNYVLLAKLNSQEDQEKVRRRELVSGKTPEGASQEEQMRLMQREIVQQETLLQGYQQENERLYSEAKKLQTNNRENEKRMFSENQRLQTEVGNLRELNEMKDRALRNKGIITGQKIQQEIAAGNTAVLGAGKIAELQAEIKEHEVREASLRSEVKRLTQGQKELEEHIEGLVREKTRQQERLDQLRNGHQTEFQDLQVKYQREIESLQKKIRWYSENQELLDRDSAALREKDVEIADLKEKLKKGGSQGNSKTSEAQRRAKERAADAKKIQDLERQVREMNDIIRRRHPNSLPALIYAAASSSSSDPKGQQGSLEGQPRSITFLEDKVKRLERELEGKEEESRKGLRVVEQKYNAMKVRYEDRISTLESQLVESEARRQLSSHPHTSLTALEKELEGVKERSRRQLQEAERENGELRRKLAKAVSTAMTGGEGGEGGGKEGESKKGGVDKGLLAKLAHHELELAAKNKELELLRSTVDKLMEERFRAWNTGEGNKGKTKKSRKQDGKSEGSGEKVTGSKPYIPENFAGSHISDVLMENERLKHQLDDLALEMEQQRVRLNASLAEMESATRQERERVAEEMTSLRSRHKMEMERVQAERAPSQTEQRISRLTNQVQAQQTTIRELQDQLSESRLETDRLAASRVRERVMETQVAQLREELREARETHSPEMKHFEDLQAKIAALESRHTQRDRDLRVLVERAALSASEEKEQEILQLKSLVEGKNLEIQRFRVELEAILEVLRELQRQGVVLPLDSQSVSSMFL
ncbi:centrosomal protein of 162 kDa-like isoform X2 [Diadema setosum]|uniref:centrosomal protein of 162 kDa-like isoform X2 n=1 Tax=Diadema setosum TaxID=31175 RepID=UPI003B3BCDF4